VLRDRLQLESRSQRRHQDPAEWMVQAARPHLFPGLRVHEGRLGALQEHRRVHGGDDGAPPGPQHAERLREEALQIAEVLQHQTAHHAVERSSRERQGLSKVVDDEAHGPGSRLSLCLCEHAGREVDRGDLGPLRCQPQRVSAGPTPEVEHLEPGHVTERLAQDRLLQRDEGVPIVIVDPGPAVVPAADRACLVPGTPAHPRLGCSGPKKQ
jgi:hypothetical protein